MQNENWEKVKDILDTVLDLDIAERPIFLDNAGLNSENRREIESLLAFEEEAEHLMHLSAVEFSRDFFDGDDESDAVVGQTFGVYKVVRELGYGGMGVVYLATRTDGKFSQRVALKLLKREINTNALRRRFQQEREILASLEHPNIARLLDAGTTDDKIPYLAMEYVEGLPIDDYCKRHELDLNQRLDLFREVCAAVDFAHRNLIVHRDLKPSNILVNNDGSPKLLDFGISKILSTEFEKADSATITKMGVMTPGYASPEQLQNKSVTTATDIYSLGIILYEILSGHRPFEAKEDDLKEIYKPVIEIDPPLPSSVIWDVGFGISDLKSSSKIAPNRTKNQNQETNPQSAIPNPKSLSGDLDNIVLKALRKEPERRYLSAENLAEDIKRHLRGLPITARPNTFSYRAEKFIKRNTASVFAGALILLAIVGGIVATLWQARAAQAERVKAERRFNDVRTLANSFLFEFSPIVENLPGSTPARELLVKRALEYLDGLSNEAGDDPEIQRELAAAYEKVGDVQGNPYNPNLGDFKGALQSYEKSLNIRQKLLESEPGNLALQSDLAQNLGIIGDLQAKGGDYAKAALPLDKALVMSEEILARNPQDFEALAKVAKNLKSRGLLHYFDGENVKAVEFYNRAKNIYDRLRVEKPDDYKMTQNYAFTHILLGEAHDWNDESELAVDNLQKGLDMSISLGEKYPNDYALRRQLMLAYMRRAENYEALEFFDTSVNLYVKSLNISETLLAADPQNFQAKRDVALGYKKLAQAVDQAGNSQESLEKLMIARRLFKEISAADPNNAEHPYDAANTLYSIGETYQTLKDHDAALETLLEAKQEYQMVLERNPENIVAVRMSSFNLEAIGNSYAALAEKSNRREFLQKAIENLRACLDGLNKLKNNGNLGNYDFEAITEIENEIKQIENKLAQ